MCYIFSECVSQVHIFTLRLSQFQLKDEFNFDYETHCDVECIIHMYGNFGMEKCITNLDGVFGCCLIDTEKHRVYVARDPFGVRPVFRLLSDNGVLGVCSEAKGNNENTNDT